MEMIAATAKNVNVFAEIDRARS